jgi:hypothetical protein
MNRYGLVRLWCGCLIFVCAAAASAGTPDPLAKAFRLPPNNGWTFVHLEGTPSEIGFQHGSLLADEIADVKALAAAELQFDTKRDWSFFRSEARTMLWPHIEKEYRDEMQGIADGAASRGGKLDIWDIVALNAWCEWEYYTGVLDKARADTVRHPSVPEHCSAFVATGSFTKDGKPVIAHNNWSTYAEGVRWTYIFDILPSSGARFLMDGLPGIISSADDFVINDAGLMITETTIGGFHGFDTTGIPEFVRARKAMQHARNIDQFAAIMKEGNNGGYANDWLVADRTTGEIASLELGLKHVTLHRSSDGYFVSANFPIDSALTREETTFNPSDSSCSGCERRVRWNQLMKRFRGVIDVDQAERFLADHFDPLAGADRPSERTLCGHIDVSPRGAGTWQPPYGSAGAVTNKVADATLAASMSFAAAAGHACGISFNAAEYLKAHPEFEWQRPFLKDMPSYPWTTFTISPSSKGTR